jgi:hypothetical protein
VHYRGLVAPGPDDEPRDEPPDEPSDEPDTGSDGADPGGEPLTGGGVEDHTALPPRLEAWRKRSATGAILTGLARGLQQVFEKEPEQPGIIMTTSGNPPKDLPVDADVEQGRPRQSVVNIRPWLLHKPEAEPDAETPPHEPGEAKTLGDAGTPGDAGIPGASGKDA